MKEEITKNRAYHSFISGLLDIGEKFTSELYKNKEDNNLVIIPLRGGYPIFLGALTVLSQNIENGMDIDINKIKVAYIPASHSKSKVSKFFEKKLEEIASNYNIDNIYLFDEVKSCASAYKTSTSVKKKFKDSKINLFLLVQDDVNYDTKIQRENLLSKLDRWGFSVNISYVKEILTMDNKNRLGCTYYLGKNSIKSYFDRSNQKLPDIIPKLVIRTYVMKPIIKKDKNKKNIIVGVIDFSFLREVIKDLAKLKIIYE